MISDQDTIKERLNVLIDILDSNNIGQRTAQALRKQLDLLEDSYATKS